MSFTESSQKDAKNRIKKVMTFGTFDLFHPWHVYYLSEAEKLGDSLSIIIARDARVRTIKGRAPHDSEDIRQSNVAHAFRDAEVILGDEQDIFAPLRAYQPDILVFGYDQRVPEEKIRELFPAIEMMRIGGFEPERWKSSILRAAKEQNEDTI